MPKEWGFILAHVALAVVFNPFTPLQLERSTWNVINVVSALALLFTLLFLDDEPITNYFDTSTGKKISHVLGIGFGIIIVFAGVMILRYTVGTMWDGIKLYRNAERIQAQVVDVKHRLESSESDEGGGQIFNEYVVSYEFQLRGKTYTGADSLHLGTMRDSYGNRFDSLYKDEISLATDERVPIQIEYEPSNPDNNKAVESMDGHETWTFGGLFMLVVGVATVISGFNMSVRNIRGMFTRNVPGVEEIL